MIYMFLADGFEEIEALYPLDLLRRSALEIQTVGIGKKEITGAHNITVSADVTDDDIEMNDADCVILPGGMPGTLNLEASKFCIECVKHVHEKGGIVAAICAAPSILGHLGILQGRNAVCFPGFESDLKGAHVSSAGVVRDGNIITAAGMGVALEFGLALVGALKDTKTAEALFTGTQAHRR